VLDGSEKVCRGHYEDWLLRRTERRERQDNQADKTDNLCTTCYYIVLFFLFIATKQGRNWKQKHMQVGKN